ncbi:nicotinate-nucleotide adenylyltransferase [Novacetimonas cocois]|uniref:Probable nicotinate-nucleotide adenylyltransferase n=1 Tax=Novacetimonas cocois TaxID=1747507 RepID=A0A365YXT7_9PROT|nr:nicotinate-nucleotide adenylyltransferase [Novacetimonas cocois]RBM08036.1 nicotinic acid mononucleotide adenylyltransferase [Novacetimonas cocois]
MGASSSTIPVHGDRRRACIGLLGGSFNPIHEGHIQLACRALRQLGLDQVWLLVSPGNPLKPVAGMAPASQRLEQARRRVAPFGRRIIATDIESRMGTRYTVDTITQLRQRFPRAHFVWLMGADGLAQMARWRRWKRIMKLVPIAILPRPGYNPAALHGRVARYMASWRRPAREAPVLARQGGCVWVFLPAPQNAISATEIRASGRGPA